MVEFSPAPDFVVPVDDGFSIALSVTSPDPKNDVRIDQLHHELCQAHGLPSEAIPAISIIGGAGIEGAVLQIVSDTQLDQTKITQVGRAHKPDQNFVHPSPASNASVDARRRQKGLPARPTVVPPGHP